MNRAFYKDCYKDCLRQNFRCAKTPVFMRLCGVFENRERSIKVRKGSIKIRRRSIKIRQNAAKGP